MQELDVTMGAPPFVPDTRHDQHYGDLFTWHDETTGSQTNRVLLRKISGPDGFLATRHGAGGPWVFSFGEERGARFTTDDGGSFVQDINYQPFGKPTSTGAQPGSPLYSNEQWNYGDYLAAFGISKVGARLYDPAIGRFLSRDPLLMPRTAATTNPYAFASNDPVNRTDPTGLDDSDDIQNIRNRLEKERDAGGKGGDGGWPSGGERGGGRPGDLTDPSIGWTSNEGGYQEPPDQSSGNTGSGSSSSGGKGTSSPISPGAALASEPTSPVVQSYSWTFLPDASVQTSQVPVLRADLIGSDMTQLGILINQGIVAPWGGRFPISVPITDKRALVEAGCGLVLAAALWAAPGVIAALATGGATQADKLEGAIPALESAAPALESAAPALESAAPALENAAVAIPDKLVLVTSWASRGVTPDLAPGRWVQLGGPTWLNFLKTGLMGPKANFGGTFPFVRFIPSEVDFPNFITGMVPRSVLRWPGGVEFWKGILGQRVLKP